MQLKVEDDEKQNTELITTNEGNGEYIEDNLITDKVETKDKSIAECDETK